LEIPEKVRRNAALMGEPGCAWLMGLPDQIIELEQRWAIKVGRPERRGSEAFVAEARTSGGLDVMVKIVVPGIDPMRQELHVLRAAQGFGYARLSCFPACRRTDARDRPAVRQSRGGAPSSRQKQPLHARECRAARFVIVAELIPLSR
jgi:hypothetical protein